MNTIKIFWDGSLALFLKNLQPKVINNFGIYSHREITGGWGILAYTVLYKCQDFSDFHIFFVRNYLIK